MEGLKITAGAQPFWALKARQQRESTSTPVYRRDERGILIMEFRGVSRVRPEIPFERMISRNTGSDIQVKLEAREPVELLVPEGPGALTLTVYNNPLNGTIETSARVSILRQDDSPPKTVSVADTNSRLLYAESFREKLLDAEIGGEIGRRLLRLAPREIEVLQGVLNDKKDFLIAEELGISPGSVGNLKQRIFFRLGASSFKEALRMLREVGLDSTFWSAS